MKCFWTILLLCGSFINLTEGIDNFSDCENLCAEPFRSALKTKSQPIVCSAAQTALHCFKLCGGEEPTEVSENDLKRLGYTCHLSGSGNHSGTVSGSLLIVLCALLLTAYRTVIQ